MDTTRQVGQKDLVDVLLKITDWDQKEKERSSKKVNFSVIPVAAGASPSGKVAVSSLNAAFYLGDQTNTNLSNVFFIPYTNLSNLRGFIMRPTIWFSENKWNVTGELRLAHNEANTYGLGTNSANKIESIVDYRHSRAYLYANKKIANYFYLGMGYNADYFYNITELKEAGLSTDFEDYGTGTMENTTSSGITFNLLRDNRKNSINADGGFYTSLIYKINTEDLGSTYNWTSLYIDFRNYTSFSNTRHKILGFWFFYWGTYGDVPYFNLPGTALDLYGRAGRGYKYGRFRGKEMLYGECEYRFDISNNGFFGGTIFVNAQSYTELLSEKFEYVKPAGGFGLRLKFNKNSDTNVTLDFAFGKDSFNWYLNLGEFF